MQRNLYFENYINNLQKEIFLLAYDSNYDIVDFILHYMKSDVRKEMDKDYSSWHNQPSRRIFEEVIINYKIDRILAQTINRDAVEWLGFFYSKWHFITDESSKTIVRFLSPIDGLKKFFVLHQLEEKEAIEICKRHYNLSRNGHRSYENNNSGESKKRYSDPKYYSFLAVRMLYKLSKDTIFNNLEYSDDEYDFVNANHEVGVKSDVIFKNDHISLIQKYNQACLALTNGYKKARKSIYFCFVFSDYYEIDDNDNEKLLLHIQEIKRERLNSSNHFDYVYFYMLGKLYEITTTNELFVYSLPFSQRERMGIINKMKNAARYSM